MLRSPIILRYIYNNNISIFNNFNNGSLRFNTNTNTNSTTTTTTVIPTTTTPTKKIILNSNTIINDEMNIFKKRPVYKRHKDITIEKKIQLFYQAIKYLGYSNPEDIYNINYLEFTKSLEGTKLFGIYNGSTTKMIYDLFPNIKWKPWLFKRNRKLAMLRKDPAYDYKDEIYWYAENNGIKEGVNLDDWYQAPIPILLKSCRIKLSGQDFRQYIIDAYPNHKFYMFKFRYPLFRIWDDPNVVKEYREFLFEKTGIVAMEQFYFITRYRFEKFLYGQSLFGRFGTNFNVLSFLFPDYQWREEYLKKEVIEKMIVDEEKKLKSYTPTQKNMIQHYNLIPAVKKAKGGYSIGSSKHKKKINSILDNNILE